MSERKVLNKYYPPDFDPSKIPKLKQSRNKQYTIRTMAPFNMRCNTCMDYIYKGRKFNAKCEMAEGEDFLGLRIFRFYIRCPKCITEIMFKTDPENTDYTLESGATRLFEAAKLIEQAERREQKQKEEDATNPMKMLETRTRDSKREMDVMENLEDLREINTRKEEVDYTEVLKRKAEAAQEMLLRQEKEDEDEIKRIFGRTSEGSLKRLQEDSDGEEDASFSPSLRKHMKASDHLVEGTTSKSKNIQSSRNEILGMIKKKNPVDTTSSHLTDQSGGRVGCDGGETSTETISHVTAGGNETPSTDAAGLLGRVPKSGSAPGVDLPNSSEGESKQCPQSSTDTGLTAASGSELPPEQPGLLSSIREGMTKKVEQAKKKETEKLSSFGMLIGYEGSDSDSSSGDE